jgi:hypothetical protein
MGCDWENLQALYVPSSAEFHERCASVGLQCPSDVFEQLFFEHHDSSEFARDLLSVDWGRVVWRERLLSGVALRHQVSIPRGYEYAVQEAREQTVREGFQDERTEVLASWREQHTWIRAPVAIVGELMGLSIRYQLRVGFTRLGALHGLLDRREVPETQLHRVWVGDTG